MSKKIADEKLAIEITADYLKEEKNIEIKKDKKLTKKDGGEPPDYYFEIGDDKIACEIRHFDTVDPEQPEWEKGKNLKHESAIAYKIVKQVQRDLNEKGIPPLHWSMNFVKPPGEFSKHAEKIVNIITTMHNESITYSNEYERNNPEKYYELFIKNNISRIDFLYCPDRANIDEKYTCSYGGAAGFLKTIEVEEIQAVIDVKNKAIPCYKKHYDQKWMIITNYQDIELVILGSAAKEAQYKCNFDKVLYIELGNRKQKRTGSRTDTFTVYELKVELKHGGY